MQQGWVVSVGVMIKAVVFQRDRQARYEKTEIKQEIKEQKRRRREKQCGTSVHRELFGSPLDSIPH